MRSYDQVPAKAEYCRQPDNPEERQSEALWGYVDRLVSASEAEIPSLLARVVDHNVEHPEMIDAPHAVQTAQVLRRSIEGAIEKELYAGWSEEVQQALLDDIVAGGPWRRYIDTGEVVRRRYGLALPIHLPQALTAIGASYYAVALHPSDWNPDAVRELGRWVDGLSGSQLQAILPFHYVSTRTVLGNNARYYGSDSFEAVEPHIPAGYTYIEAGASLGVCGAEARVPLRFRRVITTDIMSEEEALAIAEVYDCRVGDMVAYTPEVRAAINSGIDMQIWGHDITRQPMADVIPPEYRTGPFCFGMHNLLVHFKDKTAAIRNMTTRLMTPGDVLWISGGSEMNSPLLRQMVFNRTASGLELAFAQDWRQGGTIRGRADLREYVAALRYM